MSLAKDQSLNVVVSGKTDAVLKARKLIVQNLQTQVCVCARVCVFTFLGQLRRVDLIISIWGSDVRPSVRPSARKKFF